MPARTGKQYLAGLREQEREVWLEGERVKDPTTHRGLRNGARAIAALYDLQNEPKLRDEMTYLSPTTGDRVGLSFIIPRTREDLEKRRTMMLNWARTTCGMMGRSPDFMNVTYAAWAGAADYFTQGLGRPEFAENMRRYYEYIRENDLTLTHSLINLQRSRTVSGMFNLAEGTALQGCARPMPASSCGGAIRRHWPPPTGSATSAHGAVRRPTARSPSAQIRRDTGAQIPVPREL
jgi:4-hydroxyphenylacetate 3-monooxygenase